jgi:NAD-dependent SIR2 family protein deacetylase
MDRTIGTCSECGGRVTLPEAWMSTKPPIPSCEKCGATQAQPYGPVVKMRPRPVAGVVNVAARGKSATEIEAYLRGCRKVIS